MKKRIIALLLCCVMIFTLSPSLISAASADDDTAAQSAEGQVTTGETADTTGSNPPADPQPDANSGGTGAGTENGDSSDAKSGTDPASMTDAELYAHVKQLTTDEEIEAFLKQLPEARVNSLIAYAQAQEPTVVPETVVFTDAGPFMPPVNVAARRMMLRAMAATGVTADNGLELSKEATANNDGSYTIRMEAYTTGTVTTSTKTVPVDIVLVLDQSGSMSYDFNGNSTNADSARRQYAMKQAVNNFIGKVAEKYDEEADHRMAIVTFGSSASTLQGWTYVNPTIVDPDDTSGKTTLQDKINGLPNTITNQATNVAAGMSQAVNLMGTGYNYTGKNTERQKVVIVFTDGVPTTSTDFNVDVANGAIASAKKLKDGGATVYTIGIFSGANPNELYGASGFDRNSNGSVGSNWSDFSFWMIGDIKNYDIPAGNRFLNYLSSNFTDATEIGISHYQRTILGVGYRGWEITKNFTRTASTYYLTANGSDSLNNIFQTISDNIQTANIDLGNETVIKDTVSPYFDAPANVSDIKLYTAAAKSDGTFEERVAATSLTPRIIGNAVTVTGFDFNANFVSDKPKEDGTYGKKLIIEFTVTPKDGFIGGNDVPTNDWANSAVYDKSGAEVEKFADATTTPTVNVPIKDVTVTATDKNVYLLHTMTDEECKTGAEATCNGVNLLNAAEYTGVNAWKAEFVTITTNITKPTEAMTADGTYTVSVTVAPKTPVPTSTEGTIAVEKSGEKKANINVFKPELTFQDSEVYYGDTAPDYTGNLTDTEWKHGDTASTTVTMIGTAPTLSLTYTPEAGKIADGKINTKQDIAVDVAVEIDGTNVTTDTTFKHADCTGKTCTVPEGKEFLLHVKTCQLTITKNGGNANEPYVFTVFKDNEKYSEVTVMGGGSETICELPVGTYTIEEDTGWSWRFTPTIGGGVTLSKDKASNTITCTNTKANDYWLNGFSNVEKNIFGVKH